MNAIVESLMGWLAAHTYTVVFVAALIDATALPFPGRLVLAGAGAFAAAGDASAVLVVALGAAGVSLTDHAWYLVGARGGRRLLDVYCRLSGSGPDCVPRSRAWLERWGTLTIVAGRFVAAVRVLTLPLLRAHGVGYARFLALEVPTALAWTVIWVGLGWLFGERWAQASSPQARWLGLGVGALVVLMLVGRRLWRRWRQPATSAPRESAARASRGSPAAPPERPRP